MIATTPLGVAAIPPHRVLFPLHLGRPPAMANYDDAVNLHERKLSADQFRPTITDPPCNATLRNLSVSEKSLALRLARNVTANTKTRADIST
jgi:hypothetical protein